MPDDDDFQPPAVMPNGYVASMGAFLQGIDALPVTDIMTNEEAADLQSVRLQQEEVDTPLLQAAPGFDPDESSVHWAPIVSSPLYISEKFRAFARELFRNYTLVDLEDIMMTRSPPAGLIEWVKAHAVAHPEHVVDFSGLAPGVSSNVQKFSMDGSAFLLVEDFSGVMLYAWREAPTPALQGPAPQV